VRQRAVMVEGIDADSRAALEDELAFLLRSLEDLEDEAAAGDISAADLAHLRDNYVARAAAVTRLLETSDTATAGVPAAEAGRRQRRPGRQRLLVAVGLALFATAAVVLVLSEAGVRLPGQTATGTVSLNAAQQLQRQVSQAEVLEEQGKAADALALFHQVLRQDPTQSEALAESGWLEFEAGVQAGNATALAQGQHDEQAAEALSPTAFAPHLYLGSMLLVEGRPSASASEFSRFLSDSPPPAAVRSAWPFVVRAYGEAHQVVPPEPPAAIGG